MGALAEPCAEHGGEVTGIIPEFPHLARERPKLLSQELIVTRDMHERKRVMFERADAFVALPGGVGTLEELVEQLTWAELGRHKKPILVANISNYWNPLLTLIEHMRAVKFMPASMHVDILVTKRVEEILPMLGMRPAIARQQKKPWRSRPSGCDRHAFPSRKNVTASIRLPSGSRMKAA